MTRKKRAKRKKVKEVSVEKLLGDLEILEELQRDIMEKLKRSDYEPKIADLLKVLDSKAKLKLPETGKQRFWELIDQMRKDELKENEDE